MHASEIFPGGASDKEPVCQCRKHKRCGFSPCVGKTTLEEGMASLQYSCLENLMDRGDWRASVHRIIKSQTRLKRLCMHACH